MDRRHPFVRRYPCRAPGWKVLFLAGLRRIRVAVAVGYSHTTSSPPEGWIGLLVGKGALHSQ